MSGRVRQLGELVREPGADGTVHRVRGDTAGATYQARTLCGVEFYYSQHQHLWQEPPHDKPWWTRVGFVEDKEITCLTCIARL